MPTKGLTIPKALKVFHNIPSDIQSDELSLSEAEDVMNAKSSSNENSIIDEKKRGDISVPGPSRIFKVTWKNKASVKIPFTEQSEPSDEITSLQDPSLIDRKSTKWWHHIFFHFFYMIIKNSYILWSLMHSEKTPYYNNLKSFWLDLITGLVSIGYQIFPEKRFASNSYSGPVKLKLRKHTVSEKDRLKNVGHIPTKCKSRRCAYCSTRAKPHRMRWMCSNCDVGLCMIAKNNKDNNLAYYEIPTQLACAYLKGHLIGWAVDWFEVLGYKDVEGKATDYAQLKYALTEQFLVVRNRSQLETRFYASNRHENWWDTRAENRYHDTSRPQRESNRFGGQGVGDNHRSRYKMPVLGQVERGASIDLTWGRFWDKWSAADAWGQKR
ncbi:uncharacterized protein TNCV_625131 [Trichonephila clavipes]|nr:uncharacterized protein TNCV_625131 [Trichonephila clavipes]